MVDQDCTAQGLHSVGFDDRQAGILAAKHLLGLGHRRFALVEEIVYYGRGYERSWLDRQFGFEETVRSHAADLHPDSRMVQSRFNANSGPDADWRERFERILELPKDRRPTAIFVPTFEIMRGMAEFLKERSIGVPQDFSIMTVTTPFDGPPPAPWSVEVPPTVIVCDPAALGRKAAEVLLDLVAEGSEVLDLPRRHPVAVTLRKGRSTARPS